MLKAVRTGLAFLLATLANRGRLGQPLRLAAYLLALAALVVPLSFAFVLVAMDQGFPTWLLMAIALTSIFAISHLAVSFVHLLVFAVIQPKPLPRLEFSDGIPPQCRTVVAVTTVLFSRHSIQENLRALEAHLLSNPDENLHFCLLSDFSDSTTETTPSDDTLLQLAKDEIVGLNRRHPGSLADRFFLLHRPRRWNPREQIWMGRERKRGKLEDLNGLLRGDAREAFTATVGRINLLPRVKYVITADSDTQLPPGSVRGCIETMAHPSNRQVCDENGLVTSGYCILQPRMLTSPVPAGASWFQRLHRMEDDRKSPSDSFHDLYQDLFKEGSYYGKGIYDVDAFDRALRNRLPENRILSHDLIEGCYARAGTLNNVFFDEPSSPGYLADAKRRHRWIRGDWQIASWMLARVPNASRGHDSNALSYLARWKIFDNLRRSLVCPAAVFLLLVGWSKPGAASFWTSALLAIFFVPAAVESLVGFVSKPAHISFKLHLTRSGTSIFRNFATTVLLVTFILHDAIVNLDAICRAMWRLVISRTRLLEWQASSEANRQVGIGFGSYCRSMWACPAIVILLATTAPFQANSSVINLVLLFWFASPYIAWSISRSLAVPRVDDR